MKRVVVLIALVIGVSVATATRDMVSERSMGGGGLQLNTTGDMRVSEEVIEDDSWNSLTERKNCVPNLSCTRAGGYCVKSKKNCNGMVDPSGCKTKKCKCCLPDKTTPAPPTCPVVTCPTPAIGTTTPERTPAPKVCASPWVSIGSTGCFHFVYERLDWDTARTYCQNMTGDLGIFETEDKRIELNNYFGVNSITQWFWAGATHRTNSWLWLDGNTITDGWYGTQPNYEGGNNSCVNVRRFSANASFLVDWGCDNNSPFVCQK